MPAIRIASLAVVLALGGCAAAPAEKLQGTPSPLVTNSGLVIGTVSYQYVDTGSPQAWVVHFQRIDAPSSDYALTVQVDPQRHQGVFTGALPAGVYAFREVSSERRHFDAAAQKLPFEVQAGEVKDAGHIAVKPLSGI